MAPIPFIKGRNLVLDSETTGLSPRTGHRVAEIAIIEILDGVETGKVFHRYINPQRPMPWEAEAVHGLTDQFLSKQPTFEQIFPDLMAFIGDPSTPIWAHNAPFDQRFINHELNKLGVQVLPDFNCSLKLARKLLGKGDRKLSTLAKMANVKYSGRGEHSGIADAQVLAQVLVKLLWPNQESQVEIKPAKASGHSTTVIKGEKSFASNRKMISAEDPRLRICDISNSKVSLFNKGKPWTKEEDENLLTRFLDQNADFPDLVKEHGRTPAALFLRLEKFGAIPPSHPYAR